MSVQMACATNLRDSVYEVARAVAYAMPGSSAEDVADIIADFYGYTDPAARHAFMLSIEGHLQQQRM